MQASIDNLKAGVSELTAMGATKEQVFTYNNIDGSDGTTKIVDGVIVMNIAGNGNLPNGVHESSHGFDIWKSGMLKDIAAFYSGEAKAYGRQFSFGGKSAMPHSEGGNINSLKDVTINWVIGIIDSNGDYMYPKQLLGNKYNKAYIKSLLFNTK
ncbi:MAG: hypothetical protein FWF52_07345 [Candidatus Azobacteroides sp.]|nr:hypothetical protein [Candidatus Azobacteroides sp.]